MGAVDHQRLAVGAHPLAVRVAGQPHLVQELIGALGVVLRVIGRHPVFETGPRTRCRRVERLRSSEEQRLADLLTVDRQRHRLAEPDVVEDLAQHRVLVRVVEGDAAGERARRVIPQVDPVVSGALVLLVDREVGQLGKQQLHVDLAGHRPRRDVLVRLGELGALHAVDIGKLITGRVDLPVERIALPVLDARAVIVEHVGIGNRHVGVAVRNRQRSGMAAVRVVGGECLVPLFETLLLGQRAGVGVVADVPLLQVVLRGQRAGLSPRLGGRQERLGKRVPYRVLVELLRLHQLAAGGVASARFRRETAHHLIIQDGVVEKQEVVGVGILAIRPFHAAAELQGQHRGVRGQLPAAHQVGDEHRTVGRPLRHRLLQILHVFARFELRTRRIEHAAVLTDLAERAHHLGILRDALFDRRQLPVGDQRRQHRRLAELGDGVPGSRLVVRRRSKDVIHVGLTGHRRAGHQRSLGRCRRLLRAGSKRRHRSQGQSHDYRQSSTHVVFSSHPHPDALLVWSGAGGLTDPGIKRVCSPSLPRGHLLIFRIYHGTGGLDSNTERA